MYSACPRRSAADRYAALHLGGKRAGRVGVRELRPRDRLYLAADLYLFEHYNGMGYRQFGLATPYLWSFSNNEGKVRSGRRVDPELVSKQVGAATMLTALQAAGETVA